MDSVLLVDTQVLAILAGIILPLLTGIVTKLKADSAVKAVSTAVLAVITGAVATLVGEPEAGIRLYDFLFATGLAFVSSIATYYGFWRPTGISGAVQRSTASIGIGAEQSEHKSV